MKGRLAIIHFLPVEIYPPAMNLMEFLISGDHFNLQCYTTVRPYEKVEFNPGKAGIVRFPGIGKTDSPIIRLLKYYTYNVGVFIRLFFYNPSAVWYFDSYSAMPAYWYMRFFGKNKKLLIHFHEYFPKEWYETGMKTVRQYHRKEKKLLFGKASAISQTNPFRVDLFLKDHPDVPASKMALLPNYPPLRWKEYKRNIERMVEPVRTVYIGSVSLHATFLKEYCEWVIKQNGKVVFDLFTFSLDNETLNYLENLNSPYIHFQNDGIPYREIPSKIEENGYTIGIIFYKGLYDNTVYCASNKLFEYLACGLDVWFPKEMIGTWPYITEGTYPKVIKTDFERLDELNLEEMISHEGLTYKPSEYFAEKVYGDFIDKYLLHG